MPVRQLSSIPKEAHVLARDGSRLLAYDAQRRFLGVVKQPALRKRQGQATKCTPVDQSTLARLESYKLIDEAATKEWGGDWDRMLTNPPEYPDNSASVCVDGDPPSLTLEGVAQCSNEDSTASETVAQTAGNLALWYERGTTTELQMSVTQSSMFPWLTGPVLAQINMPALSPNLEAFPADVSINNQATANANVDKNTLRNTTVTAPASAGQTCSLNLTKSTCTGSGTGRIRITAQGWVWLNYPSTRNGHFHWALSIEQTIPDVEARSSYLEFHATAQSNGFTRATPQCAFANGPSSPNPSPTSPSDLNPAPKESTVSPVLVAVPVVLGCVAIILGIVAFIIWRRRRRERERQGQPGHPHQRGHARMPSASTVAATSMTQSQHPGVTPVFFPLGGSSAPSTQVSNHSRANPSVDTSFVSNGMAGAYQPPVPAPRMGEKGRPIGATYGDPGAAGAGAMSPGGALPPAYSETPSTSSHPAHPAPHSAPRSNVSYSSS